MEGSEVTKAPAQPADNNNGKGRNRKFVFALLGALAVVGAVFMAKWLVFRFTWTSTDDAQVDADLLPISFKVPGRIVRIDVGEGDLVRAGQILAELDDTDYRLALGQAEARLAAVSSDLRKAESSLSLTETRTRIGVLQSGASLGQFEGSVTITSTQQAVNFDKLNKDLERAEINLDRVRERYGEAQALADQAERDFARAEGLYNSGVLSKEQYERSRTNADSMKARLAQAGQEKSDAEKQVETARSNLRAAKIDTARTDISEQDVRKANLALDLSKKQQREEVSIAETTVEGLRAQVRAAEAAAELARVALRETRIVSPVDGIVAKKISLPSEIVPAGKPVFFVIDTGSLRVTANIEETNLIHVRAGYKARVTVDALPGRTYKGVVKTIGAASNSKFSLIPASNPSGQFIKTTQRIPIRIHLSGDLSDLKPGMNVVVAIKNKQ